MGPLCATLTVETFACLGVVAEVKVEAEVCTARSSLSGGGKVGAKVWLDRFSFLVGDGIAAEVCFNPSFFLVGDGVASVDEEKTE